MRFSDSYTRIDLRLDRAFKSRWIFSVSIENLFGDAHQEFADSAVVATEVPRTVYGQVTLKV